MIKFSDVFSEYIFSEFRDEKAGGLFASINRNNDDIVTADKLLSDVAMAMIAYSEAGKTEQVSILLKDLQNFKDPQFEGYYEILDVTGAIHPVGKVKTIINQLIAGYGLYVAGKLLNLEDEKKIGESIILYVVSKYLEFGSARRLENNWLGIIDDNISLTDLSFIVYVLINTSNLKYINNNIFELVDSFFDENKGAFSYLNSDKKAKRASGKSLGKMSLFVVALIKLYKITKNQKYQLMANNIINFINLNMKHNLYGGFWNSCNSDGIVSMDAISAYYNNESPFPYQSVLDEALFMLALRYFSKSFGENDFISNLYKETLSNIIKYYDCRNGGVSMGKGCWFTSPTDPTVPLARHVMVPPHTVGSFSVGNTCYVPLHQKQAFVQLICMLVLSNEEFCTESKSLREIQYKEETFDNNLNYISDDSLDNSFINIEGYLKWLHKTKSGLGYGLTPYKSPLGFRSDKTQQNFSILHVISDLTVLKQNIENKTDILKAMYSCQNSDGGFGEQPSLLSELFTTYCVVLTAAILHDNNYDKQGCIEFLKSCQNVDGGFGNAPGYLSDIWHTNLGVLALHALGEEPKSKRNAVQYILNNRNADGGYGIMPGIISDTFSTFRAVDSLLILNIEIPDKNQSIGWLQKQQVADGGFKYQESKGVSFVGSYHAIAALYILGSLPTQIEQCQKWLASHQMKDGGFSRSILGPSDTTDEGFIAIQASYMLEKKLNPYWAALIT